MYNVYMNGELVGEFAEKSEACKFARELMYDYRSAKIVIKTV